MWSTLTPNSTIRKLAFAQSPKNVHGDPVGTTVQKNQKTNQAITLKIRTKFLLVLDLLTISHIGIKAKNPSTA